MKLELKHLAGYLPYRLNMMFDGKVFGVLSGIRPNLLTELIVIEDIDNNTPIYKNWCVHDTKLILRPLSDLAKEIEVNGIIMNPLINLKTQGYNLDFDDDFTFEDFIKGDFLNNSYGFVQLLLCWHFDIYGLIENGLAIDINTLNK